MSQACQSGRSSSCWPVTRSGPRSRNGSSLILAGTVCRWDCESKVLQYLQLSPVSTHGKLRHCSVSTQLLIYRCLMSSSLPRWATEYRSTLSGWCTSSGVKMVENDHIALKNEGNNKNWKDTKIQFGYFIWHACIRQQAFMAMKYTSVITYHITTGHEHESHRWAKQYNVSDIRC